MSPRGQRNLLVLLLAALVFALLKIAWPFLSSLVLASMLAVVMNPLNKRLERRIGRPGFATLLTTTVTVVVLCAPLVFACVSAVQSTKSAYNAMIQRSANQGGASETMAQRMDRIVDLLSQKLPVSKTTLRSEMDAGLKRGAGYVVNTMQGAIATTTSLIVTTVFAAIFLFYLLRYGEGWVTRMTELAPLNPDITNKLLGTAHRSIVGNVQGVFGVALAQGAFLGLGFWLVGIGSPLQWGLFGALASVVPFVGATLIWVPAVLGFLLVGSYGKALALALWGGLVVGSLDNFLRPWIVGVKEKENPVLVGFAMLGGTYAIGPVGLLFGPLIVSLTGAVIEALKETARDNASLGPIRLKIEQATNQK